MPPPLDPLRLRIFSELNLQLSHPSIPKSLLNETSKHLAFLVRYYTNDPDCDPFRVSVPIIKVLVPLMSKEEETDTEVETVLKIALVVFDEGEYGKERRRESPVSMRMEGLRKIKMEKLYGVGKMLGGGGGEESRDDMTSTEKTKSDSKAGVTGRKVDGGRRDTSASASGIGSSISSTAAKSRMHVLVEATGTLGHYKCMVAKFCGMAERVIGGLLAGDEDVVHACEEVRKKRGNKASGGVARRPVWDVETWGDYS
ncbi:hypothetical protein BKA58DRAFT_435054 [Alternaria rosae]|uniref:uncharacterized protein n=1 Tax=Alternaria rosae TaxID=1187941 RepID=UPI001E8D72BB|nr:uncharacterized protein BKA58DRAFT_435054 [Alternaria rosae]KAH6883309.1 hypothetical protein BKA58DRAFT_435054 [Alternaria rosae]